MFDRILDALCKMMHKQAMWPIHGRYLCTRCLREHRVEWESTAWRGEAADQPVRERPVSIPSAVEATR